jgi:hypothetical protein
VRVVQDPGAAGSGFAAAVALSTAYIALLLASELALDRAAPWLAFAPVSAAVGTAIALDLVAEWRAHRRRDDLVAAWPIHRVQLVDLAVRALRSAGIEVHARGLHHRTMLFFFGPFIPVLLMVPRDEAERARDLLESTFSTADPPAA